MKFKLVIMGVLVVVILVLVLVGCGSSFLSFSLSLFKKSLFLSLLVKIIKVVKLIVGSKMKVGIYNFEEENYLYGYWIKMSIIVNNNGKIIKFSYD